MGHHTKGIGNQGHNCRFRAKFHGSDVIITISPGQTLEHYQGAPDDEGWSSQCTTYELSGDGTELVAEYIDDGQDCDGRLTRFYSSRADAFRLDNSRWPHWTDLEAYQRDQYAEAMGY